MKCFWHTWMIALILAWSGLAQAAADPSNSLVVAAEKAYEKTEGGAVPGGWNLWSNGHVGQPMRFARAGVYQVVVRAWGSPAAGVWPEMAILVDELAGETVRVDRAEPADYRFQVRLSAGTHEIAAGFTNDAKIGSEDRNLYLERITITTPEGVDAPVATDGSERAEEAERREQEIVAATELAIEKNRKSDAVVRVVDAAGKPVKGATVKVTQTGHEFLFGCNIFGLGHFRTEAQNAAYAKRFEELFNYATTGFYWVGYEHERGRPNYAETDRVIAWCAERDIRLKGHPLLWGDDAGIPPWSHGQPSADLQRQRVRDIIDRYHDRIGFWEVVNEPSHQPLPKIDEPYRWAREVDPDAYLIVNDYHVMADGAPAFFRLLNDAKEHGVPFDGIGIQAHEPRTMRFPLDRVQTLLDRYATLGKELHITEFTPTSAGDKIVGSHRTGVWDEEAQADYAVKFYRVCFAHPALRAITWWDLCDAQSWLPGGGMLRRDLSPKPVYDRLKHLIHEEWQTRLDGTTNAQGQFAYRGFRGTYRIAVEADGKTTDAAFQLAKGKGLTLVITMP